MRTIRDTPTRDRANSCPLPSEENQLMADLCGVDMARIKTWEHRVLRWVVASVCVMCWVILFVVWYQTGH